MEKLSIPKLIFFLTFLKSSICEEIICEPFFSLFTDENYSCEMKNIFDEPVEATSVDFNHFMFRTNTDTKIIRVRNLENKENTKYYPSNVCIFLVNLKHFLLESPAVLEIKREIFSGCEKLVDIRLKYFKFKKLEDDLFADVPNLKSIFISESDLEVLQKNIFQNNPQLKEIVIYSNKLKIIEVEFPNNLTVLTLLDNLCIDLKYDHEDNRSMPLEQVIKKVEENCRNSSTNQLQLLESSDEPRIKLLEGKIEKLEEKNMIINTQVLLKSRDLNRQFVLVNMKARVLNEDIEELQNSVNGELTEKVAKATEEIEEIHTKINQIAEESHEMKHKIDAILVLEVQSEELREEMNGDENLMIGLFILQVISIACAITFYFFFLKIHGNNHEEERAKSKRMMRESLISDDDL